MKRIGLLIACSLALTSTVVVVEAKERSLYDPGKEMSISLNSAPVANEIIFSPSYELTAPAAISQEIQLNKSSLICMEQDSFKHIDPGLHRQGNSFVLLSTGAIFSRYTLKEKPDNIPKI
jgi:hypothetical protein